MSQHDDPFDVAKAIQAWFAQCLTPENHPDPTDHVALRALEASLLRPEVRKYIEPLVVKHHLELEGILGFLVTFRLRWEHDPHAIFGLTLAEIEALPGVLMHSAVILDGVGPWLGQAWSTRIHEIRNARAMDVEAVLRLRKRTGRLEASAKTPREMLRAQTVREQSDLADIGLILADTGLTLRDALGLTSMLLVRAARTIAEQDWPTATTADGRKVFGCHRRRELWIERECANALLILFEYETSRPLYEYVGALLAATFPSLEHWARAHRRRRAGDEWGHARLRDRVKQLTGRRGNRGYRTRLLKREIRL